MKAQAIKQDQKTAGRKPAATAPRLHAITPLSSPPLRAQRKSCACGGECPRCQQNPPLQAKLEISQPGDVLEREADLVAEQVMRMPQPGHPGEAEAHENGPRVSRYSSASTSQRLGDALPIVREVIRSPGQPLDAATRAFMEPRFGQDIGHVRVHTDLGAARSAEGLNALAYTVGSHVVFGEGQYAPSTAAGRKLFAHEITHTLQQVDGAQPTVRRQTSDPWIPMPVFDEFDPCIIVPEGLPSPLDILGGQQACGSTARAIIDFLGGRGGGGPQTQCPPGWRAATSTDFRGQCCRGTIDSATDCCPPSRIALLESRCCGPDEVVQDNRCVRSTDIPIPPNLLCLPSQRTLMGECCTPPMVPQGLTSCGLPPVTPQPVTPPGLVLPTATEIFFRLDRPAAWETGASSLASAATSTGLANFRQLVVDLQANPALRVQLVGRASPEGTDDYNLDLGARRARLVAAALSDAGIPSDRITDPPVAELRPECVTLDAGIVTCGEVGAGGDTDRQVLARVFPVQ